MENLRGVHKPRLVVDASSIVTACAFVRHEEDETEVVFEGKKYWIQDVEDIFDTFKGTFIKTLKTLQFNPQDVIFVKDPENSRGLRLKISPDYKGNRDPRPPEWYEAYTLAMQKIELFIKEYGGIVATPGKGWEADDLIAEISNRFRDTVIWSRDRDLQCLEGDIFIEGELNPIHKSGLDNPLHIKVWKTLVDGDTSDNVKSVYGFGQKKFEQLIEMFGDDGLDLMADLLENDQLHTLEEDVEALPCLQLILDDLETAYTAWELFSFIHVPAHKVKWEAGMQKFRLDDGMEEWMSVKRLITDGNIEKFADEIKKALESADQVALDIETDVPEESREWLAQNGQFIDIFGSELAGCGITAGKLNVYFPINHADTDNVILPDLKLVLSWIPRETPIICHRAGGFELPVLYRVFGEDQDWGDHGFLPNVHDTKIAANYVNEQIPTGLKALSKRHLKYIQLTYEETLGEASGMFEISGKDVLAYGLDDTITTDALWNLYTAIMEYERTIDVFVEVEQDCQYSVALGFHKGVGCDLEKVQELVDRDQKLYDENLKKFNSYLMDLTWQTSTLVVDPVTNKKVPEYEQHKWPGTFFDPLTELNGVQLKRMHRVLYGAPFKTQVRKIEKLAEFFTEEDLREAILSEDLDRVNAEYEARWVPNPEFNVNSAPNCVKLMYDCLNFPVRVRNKPTPKMIKEKRPGTPSTDEDAIKNAIAFGDVGEHEEMFKLLLELKKLSTRFSLFYNKYPDLKHWKDGLFHPQLRQTSTTTRRFSHSAPNLGQMPKKKGKDLRAMLIPPDPENYVMCTQDIDSQELKLQAWECQDENFLSCFIGEDQKSLHSLTGFGIVQKKGGAWNTFEEFQQAIDDGDQDAAVKRHQGKETNFSTSYLCMAKTLGIMLCVTEEEAQEFMDAKGLAFPGLMPYVESYIEKCAERKYSTTMMGGRRHLSVMFAIGKSDKFTHAKAGRLAWSFKIQGSAGEQTKLIMGRMWRSGVYFDYDCWPVTSIHDEVVNIIHKDVVDDVIPILHDCVCADYGGMGIPTTSTPEVGPNFAECKPYKFEEEVDG